jgi:hypothetical protein
LEEKMDGIRDSMRESLNKELLLSEKEMSGLKN